MGFWSELYEIYKRMKHAKAQQRAAEARKDRYIDDSEHNQLWLSIIETQRMIIEHVESIHTKVKSRSETTEVIIPPSDVQAPIANYIPTRSSYLKEAIAARRAHGNTITNS